MTKKVAQATIDQKEEMSQAVLKYTAPIVVDIYCRVSTDDQEENTSLEGQETDARQYCMKHGFIVGMVHREVFSGYKYRERKRLEEMRQRYRDGKIQGVVIRTLDRLSRSQAHIAILMEEMQFHNITLYSVKEIIDETPMGKFARMVLAFVAEMEREKILDRTITGRLNRAKEGNIARAVGGVKPTYGWKWDIDENGEKVGIIHDEKQATILRQAGEEYARGVSLNAITARFHREGILTPTGKAFWDTAALRRMLVDPRMSGKNIFIFRGQDKRSKVHLDPIPVPDGTYPAIVDEETYAKIMERVEINKIESERNSSQTEAFLLRAGFVRCSCCGYSMNTSAKASFPLYVCPNTKTKCKVRSSASLLDKEVWERVSVIADHIGLIQEAMEAAKKAHTREDDLKATEAAIATCKAQIENYECDLKDPTLRGNTRAGIRNLLNIAYSNLEELEKERAVLAIHSVDVERQRVEFDKIIEWCKKTKECREELSYTEKRNFLRLLGVSVLAKSVEKGTGRMAVSWDVKVKLPEIEKIIYHHSASSFLGDKRLTSYLLLEGPRCWFYAQLIL